jgi:hypothetical protein
MMRLHCETKNNPNNPNAGISGSVCVNHLWPVVAGGGGMKDEVLKLALAALEGVVKNCWRDIPSWRLDEIKERITAIKQALAAPVQEPIGYAVPTFDFDNSVIKKVHYAGTVPLYTAPPAAPVQPVASLKEVDVLMMAETHGIDPSTKGLYGFYIDCISNQPAAQRQWVGLTDEEFDYLRDNNFGVSPLISAVESKLKEKNAAAQPAVPDAIHHTDLSEHPQYIEGWNDCRAEMLKGMK